MAPKYKQEMPPPGGYQDIDWAKRVIKKRIGGFTMFGLFSAFTASMWILYHFERKRQRKFELEMRDARIAIVPLIVAEQQRTMLKQFLANREEEEELMKNVEGWKVGTLWGEPVYHNVRNRWIWPATEEYFAHCDYWEKFNLVNDKLNH